MHSFITKFCFSWYKKLYPGLDDDFEDTFITVPNMQKKFGSSFALSSQRDDSFVLSDTEKKKKKRRKKAKSKKKEKTKVKMELIKN